MSPRHKSTDMAAAGHKRVNSEPKRLGRLQHASAATAAESGRTAGNPDRVAGALYDARISLIRPAPYRGK